MHIHPLGNVHDQLDIGIIVIVRAARNLQPNCQPWIRFFICPNILPNLVVSQTAEITDLNILIGHPNVVCIGP